MDSLPIEMWHYIFNFLKSDDLLNCREICRKWNTISLATFKWSNLNIGFRNNKDVAEFCEMMKQSSGGLKFCNFFLKFNGKHLICDFNLTRLSKEIGPYAVSYYFYIGYRTVPNIVKNCTTCFSIPMDTINILLNATPNLRKLFIITELDVFPTPSFRPLKKLEELHLKRRYKDKIELEAVTNWIMKAPSLKKFHSNFEFQFQDSEISQYFQLLKEIPEVCMYVYFSRNHERYLEELQSVHITEFHLEMKYADKQEVCTAIYSLLEKQSGHLHTLRIGTISGITNFTLPFLPKLTTFEVIPTYWDEKPLTFSLFDPKNLPCLQKVNLDRELSTKPLHNPFIQGEYSTVTKLILWTYSTQDWRKMFPRLKKLSTCIPNLDLLMHLLANPPTDYLALKISDPQLTDYLIANPSSVPKIGINLDDTFHWVYTTESKIKLWNAITGHALIESGSILSIKGINDIQVPHETEIRRSIADIKNLWKLRLFGSEEVLKGIAYLSQKQVSFPSLKKLTVNESSNECKTLYANLRKLPTWNFNLETINFNARLAASAYDPTFSQKKIPEHILENILNRSKKYATLIL